MAFTSTFYDTSAGTPSSLITEIKWAKAHPQIGASQYGVEDANDFKVTANSGTPYTVNISSGTAWGHGVHDISDSTVTKTASGPSSGTRWDLVAIRRNWAPFAGGPTSIVIVQGGSSRQIPGGRVQGPGTLDDQPLALVKWSAGETLPLEIIDLRCWAGNGGLFARDDLARSYLDTIGAQVTINDIKWLYTIGANGTAGWVRDGEIGKIPLFGASNSALFGPNPATEVAKGTQFLVQAGTHVTSSDGAGYARVTFPKPFPNGLLTVILTNGDSSVDRARSTGLTLSVAGHPWNTGQLDFFVYSLTYAGGANLITQPHRVNWMALGW